MNLWQTVLVAIAVYVVLGFALTVAILLWVRNQNERIVRESIGTAVRDIARANGILVGGPEVESQRARAAHRSYVRKADGTVQFSDGTVWPKGKPVPGAPVLFHAEPEA